MGELRRILPGEDIVYFGDTGRVPYGTRSRETLFTYAKEDIGVLERFGVKIVLAACGTVSSTVLDDVTGGAKEPVFGVVDAAVEAAIATGACRIGLIGTEATVASGAFEKKMRAKKADLQTMSVACPLLVPLVENGFIGEDSDITRLVLEKYLEPFRAFRPQTLILGCTHFPIVADRIAEILPETVLIDPAKEAAGMVKKELTASGLCAAGGRMGETRYLVSDAPEKFAKNAWIFLGGDEEIRAEKVQQRE